MICVESRVAWPASTLASAALVATSTIASAAPVAPGNPAASLSVAKSVRASTPAGKDKLAGGGLIAAVIAAGVVAIGVIAIVNDSDDSDR